MEDYGGFEGNAQTLRLLTETLFGDGREGMNPTRALLDAVLKYKTLHRDAGRRGESFPLRRAGALLRFVLGGADFPADLPPGKIRNGLRSLECQIMDWADDTAYSINDIVRRHPRRLHHRDQARSLGGEAVPRPAKKPGMSSS